VWRNYSLSLSIFRQHISYIRSSRSLKRRINLSEDPFVRSFIGGLNLSGIAFSLGINFAHRIGGGIIAPEFSLSQLPSFAGARGKGGIL